MSRVTTGMRKETEHEHTLSTYASQKMFLKVKLDISLRMLLNRLENLDGFPGDLKSRGWYQQLSNSTPHER